MKSRIIWHRLGGSPGDHVVHLPAGARVLHAGLHNGVAGLCVKAPDPPQSAELGRPHLFSLVETGVGFDSERCAFRGVVELPAATLHVFEQLQLRTAETVQSRGESIPADQVPRRLEALEDNFEEAIDGLRVRCEALEGSGTHQPEGEPS